MTNKKIDPLESLTQEECDALPELTEAEIKEALDKGRRDMELVRAKFRKRPNCY